MSRDSRKAQLEGAARAYFEALAQKDFDRIPYHEEVVVRAPLAPGGMRRPLVGREKVRKRWWAPLPAILGTVKIVELYYNDDLTAVVAEAEVEITKPKVRLRVADRFTVDDQGRIVEQVNHFDAREVTNPS
jgi:hypothetical protein